MELETEVVREVEKALKNKKRDEVVRLESKDKTKINRYEKAFASYKTLRGSFFNLDDMLPHKIYTLDIIGDKR